MSGLTNTLPVSPPPGVKSVASNSGSAVTQPAVVAASFPLGQAEVATVEVAPSALKVTLPLKPSFAKSLKSPFGWYETSPDAP